MKGLVSVLPKAEVYVVKGFGLNTEAAFNRFKDTLPWSFKYGHMQCVLGQDYVFSGQVNKGNPMPVAIERLMARINEYLGSNLNSCYANHYLHGNQGLGYHTDKEPQLEMSQPVVSISYGTSRTFWFKDIATGEEYPILLEDGDLVVMGKDSQIKYLHSIKKEPLIVGERISLTFRCFK